MKHRWLIMSCLVIVSCITLWASTSRPGEASTLSLPLTTSTESTLRLAGQLGGSITALAAQGSYAYLGHGSRLEIYQISSPNHPAIIWRSPVLADTIADIALAGSYAFVAARNDDLYIFDIFHPDAPQQLAHFALSSGSSISAVAVQGTTAYLGTWNGMYIVDVSNPAQPLELGYYPNSTGYPITQIKLMGQSAYALLPGQGLTIVNVANPSAPVKSGDYLTDTLTALEVVGNYAYVTAGGNGLRVIDVSNPALPMEVASYDTSAYARDILILGNTAYIGSGNLTLIDVSAPTAPRFIRSSSISAEYLALSNGYLLTGNHYEGSLRVVSLANQAYPHEIAHVNSVSGYTLDVAISGQYAYLPDMYSRQLHVVNTFDPREPTIVSSLSMEGYPSRIVIAGRYAYLTTWNGLKIVDIANPAALLELGTFYTTSLSLQDVFVQDHYAYLADGNNGLRIVDVANPSAPVQAGRYDTPGTASVVAVVGSYAYVSDYPGLSIINVANPAAPILAGTLYADAHISAIVSAPPYVYLGSNNGLTILDATNPAAPGEVGSYFFPAYNILKDKNLLYLYTGSGFQTVDVSNPISPKALSYVPAPVSINALAVQGEYLYFATYESGLLTGRPTDQATAFVSPVGDTLTSVLDHTTYIFPVNAFTTTVTVRHTLLRHNEIPPLGSLIGAGHYFETSAAPAYTDQSIQPLEPYTLTIVYAPSELGAVAEETLALYYWDGQQWVKEPTGILDQSTHTLTATPQRFTYWAMAGAARRQVYLPVLMRNAGRQTDLSITGVEVTQAIQNAANNVPLVANRPTVVRIYARNTGTEPVDNVYLSVTASRNGAPLAGSPLILGPWAVFSSSTRGTYASSFNATLPVAWLSGQINLEIKLDSTQAIVESDETNNVTALQATFNPVPPLKIKIVPINYTHTPTGKFFPAPAANLLGDYILRTYPLSAVSVTLRAPINFSGNLGNGSDWTRLLNTVTNVKSTDGSPEAQVYYGLIPTTNPAGDTYNSAWGGYGWIGRRAAIGLNGALNEQDLSGIEGNGNLAAHEIGHNFGLPHAPCGNPGGPDPAYPYPDASINDYGFDTRLNRIWSPDAPDFTKDVMSYCGPQWFSDYNYKKLYANQLTKGALSTARRITNLFVRVVFDNDGTAHFQPIYTFDGVPSNPPTDSPYTIDLLNDQNTVIASYPVKVWEAEERGLAAQAIDALLPRPSADIASLRLTRSGHTLIEQALHTQAGLQTSSLHSTSTTTELHWAEPEIPVMIRYTADHGQTWTTVAFDVIGGVIPIDSQQWPTDDGYFEVISADAHEAQP